jgi:hypothetical protein
LLILAIVATTGVGIVGALAEQPSAESARERMRRFRTTGTPHDLEQVPQTGWKSEQFNRRLRRIKLPPGFQITRHAVVHDARHIAVTRNNANVLVGTHKPNIYVVVDREKDRVADEAKRFAPAVGFTQPSPCYSPDGFVKAMRQEAPPIRTAYAAV